MRYADDFVIGVNNPTTLPKIESALTDFLGMRGLTLSDEKTKRIQWTIGKKIDFLS